MKKDTCKIDIHAHILPIDHGSSLELETIEMLKEAKKYKVKKIVCTSHYYSDDYELVFDNMSKIAKKYGISLYRGNEVLIDDYLDIIDRKVNLINDYVLIELRRKNKLKLSAIIDILQQITDSGIKIIFAHPELVNLSISQIKKLKKLNILMQIDAYSFYKERESFVKKMLDNDLVDIVASDIHYTNNGYFYLNEFYDYVLNNYGKEKARLLFYENPKKIIE